MTEITQDSWFARLATRAQGGPSELSTILGLASSGGDLIDFSGGFPDPTLYDTQLLGETAAKAIESKPQVALQYAPNYGLASLRDVLRDEIACTQGVAPAEDELIVTSGGVDALTLVSKAMLDHGDAVLVEAPSYHLGPTVVLNRVPGAMHDLFLSHQTAQTEAFTGLLRFARGFLTASHAKPSDLADPRHERIHLS